MYGLWNLDTSVKAGHVVCRYHVHLVVHAHASDSLEGCDLWHVKISAALVSNFYAHDDSLHRTLDSFTKSQLPIILSPIC